MADSVETVKKQTADAVGAVAAVTAVTKPVNTWRRMIAGAGAIVAKPWRRYRVVRLLMGDKSGEAV
jgi:hypothetical protein